ncbi:MAG: transcription-repair coupling factor [Acidobacteriota bacterium]|nr:transcription-repair coupling factor [Acidobacteriota bacterium]
MSLGFLFDSPEYRELVHFVDKGESGVSIRGVAAAARPYLLAGLARTTGRTVVIVQASRRALKPPAESCAFFLSLFGPHRGAVSFPELSDSPYQEIPPSLEARSRRMRFFHSLTGPGPSVCVTNLPALLKPFPSPEDLEKSFLDLSPETSVSRESLLETLEAWGYAREDIVASPGEYAARGGIIDVFSPWLDNPVRIELSADRVASLREFDSATQKSIRRASRIIVPSLREFPGDPVFFREWTQEARRLSSGARRDFEAKVEALAGGEIIPSFAYAAVLKKDRFAPFSRFLSDAVLIVDDPDALEQDWRERTEEWNSQYQGLRDAGMFALSPDDIFPPPLRDLLMARAFHFEDLSRDEEGPAVSFISQPVPRFANRIPFFLEYLARLHRERDRCSIFLRDQGTRRRLGLLLEEHGIPAVESDAPLESSGRSDVRLLLGALSRGFSFPRDKVVVFAEGDIFTEEKVLVSRAVRKSFVSQFQDLKSGDTVVHVDYGVGVFQGLRKLAVEEKNREFIEIGYRDGDTLLVPVEDLNLVQKFSSSGETRPDLDKLGTQTWEKTKTRARKAVEAVARELLDLYARRKAAKGFAFSPGGEWETEFDRMFTHEETDDQLRAIREIRRDMESPQPMDRLLCGDVGYGKTEVAMRAAFKAVMDGKQVAVLCPTTVLAGQHLTTFRSRMVLFPVRIEALSRFQSAEHRAEVLSDLRRGFVDIVIGTHRLLSGDVAFKDLGLLIVDEEQRFGVRHKEKIKELKAQVDVLTMTATPIPRTLNMSLAGLRDISLIETPPRDRLAVHTVVTPFNTDLVASAIRHELGRGGQVYYLHNRVEDIDKAAALMLRLVPQARVSVVHGRMAGAQLEKRMMDFVEGRSDILVSTTIIENGIDIPLVNTLIVDRADLFGLAQLYQLRGRVGRSARQAFAYFLVPAAHELTPAARERLTALKEFSELGSGFRLAARDLEIRGAGHLLGHRQHGVLEAVGFDYFMQLLDRSVRELKGETVEDVKCVINLRVDIRVPEDYLPQVNLRLNLYKRLSSIEDPDEVDRIRSEIADRFGEPPETVECLLRFGAVKLLSRQILAESVDRNGDRILIKLSPSTPVELTRLSGILKARSGSFSPQGVMSLRIRVHSDREILDETIRILKELSGWAIMN